MRPILFVGLMASVGCNGKSDTASDALCGDLDGPDGADTGNLPNILGTWTSSFGTELFVEDCAIGGMKQEDMDWINGGAMEVRGTVPHEFYATFDRADDELYWGVMNQYGGVVFTGVHMHDGYEMQVSFGGQFYENAYQERVKIEGFAYMAVDSSGDGEFDCRLNGDFVGNQSAF